MLEPLLAVGIGVLAALLSWWVARWAGPVGTRGHRVTLLAATVILFTVGSATLLPLVRAWKQERDVAHLLGTEPLFAALLEDDPSLRAPLRAGLLQAVREGPPDEAALAGRRLLSARLWQYVPRASDAATLQLGRALVATLARLHASDPDHCYRFLFPAAAAPAAGPGPAVDEEILIALGDVVASTRDGSAGPLDREAAQRQVDAAFARLRERHGVEVDVLRHAREPDVDRERVCAMTIALYAELVALPPGPAGQALRHVLGPEAPPSGD